MKSFDWKEKDKKAVHLGGGKSGEVLSPRAHTAGAARLFRLTHKGRIE